MTGDAASGTVRGAKTQLRATLLRRRRERSDADRAAAGAALAAHVGADPLLARPRRVAAYHAMPGEPPTDELIAALLATGREVVVPVVDDAGLDWVAVVPGATLVRSSLGIPEPDGPRLGADALAGCDLVLVPALAADHGGHRLGRGAGYYDRALPRATAPLVAVVFADELLPEVPTESHDVPVQAVLTPTGLFRVP